MPRKGLLHSLWLNSLGHSCRITNWIEAGFDRGQGVVCCLFIRYFLFYSVTSFGCHCDPTWNQDFIIKQWCVIILCGCEGILSSEALRFNFVIKTEGWTNVWILFFFFFFPRKPFEFFINVLETERHFNNSRRKCIYFIYLLFLCGSLFGSITND